MALKKVKIPEGESGNWKVEQFTISKKDARFATLSYGCRSPLPGTYTRLMHNRYLIMSDTNAEMRDHWEPVYRSTGDILIHGLGIGMVLYNALLKPDVNHATVIELSPDVIKLVAPWYEKEFGNRVTIIEADAFKWKAPKGKKYGMIWHDIWPDICGDNYEEMKFLHRRYGRKSIWQGSWCHYETKRAA